MHSILGMVAICLTACASHPLDNTPRQVKVDASNIVEVQKAGYIIKDKDGQRLYCAKEMKTGSHIETSTMCFTEQEWERIHEASQRGIEAISTQPPPPQGH